MQRQFTEQPMAFRKGDFCEAMDILNKGAENIFKEESEDEQERKDLGINIYDELVKLVIEAMEEEKE